MVQLLDLAIACHQSGRLTEAEAHYRTLLNSSPDNPDGLRLYGLLLHQQGESELGLELLNKALRVAPHSPRAHDSLGYILASQGDIETAIAHFRRAVDITPAFAQAHFNLGSALQRQGDVNEAIRAFQNFLALQPDVGEAQAKIGELYLRRNQPTEAYQHIEKSLALAPNDIWALALKSVCLSELGRAEAAAELSDPSHVLRLEDINLTYRDRPLSARLAEFVSNHPSLHQDKTTQNGLDTTNLFANADPMMAFFRGLVSLVVKDYLEELRHKPGNPFQTLKTTEFKLHAWGVKMWGGGYQVPHNHPTGWISGVFYAKLPAAVAKTDGSHAGWIEFGTPPKEYVHRSRPRTRLVQPQEGKIILFPSYIWHRTLPFEGEEERISLAFDAMPTAYS